mgnify:FL=1
MNSKEFLNAVELLKKEKNIPEDTIYEAMELALTSAYKKHFQSLDNVRVEIDRKKGDIKVFSFITIVSDDDFEDERYQMIYEEAIKEIPDIQIGDTIETEVTPKDFGRVAAATAKQVVVQKIREAERNIIIEEFGDKQDEMVSGLVAMEDQRNYYIDLGKTQGILPKTECIPNEQIKMGSSLKVYITKVDSN